LLSGSKITKKYALCEFGIAAMLRLVIISNTRSLSRDAKILNFTDFMFIYHYHLVQPSMKPAAATHPTPNPQTHIEKYSLTSVCRKYATIRCKLKLNV